MEDQSLIIDSASISTAVVVSMLTAYVFYRSMVASTSTFSLLRGKSRSIASLMLRLSALSSTIYNITLYFLSTKFQIDKISLELFGTFDKHYTIKYNEYNIDLGVVLISSLKAADILFISSIFMCISIVTPRSQYLTSPKGNTTISLISKFWAVMRIPLVYYSGLLSRVANEKLVLFLMLLFYNAELVVASILLVILRFRNAELRNSNADAGFLACSIFLYGFLKYSINYIDFPFKINRAVLGFVYSFQYVLSISICLLMCDIVFPRKDKAGLIPYEKPEHIQSSNVAVLEEVIEFEESSRPKLIN